MYPDFAWSQTDTSPSQDANPWCLRIGTLDKESFLMLQAANQDDSVYRHVGLLEIHMDIKRDKYSKIEEIERAVDESTFEEVIII
jgi:hypothetical protein